MTEILFKGDEMNILTTQQLADRWKCTTQNITEKCRAGELHYIKEAPKYRFSEQYIREIEERDLNPLSPMERRRLEKQIENLKEQLSEKDRYINQFRSLALQQI